MCGPQREPSRRHRFEIRSRSSDGRSRFSESAFRSGEGASVTLREGLSAFAETPPERAERIREVLDPPEAFAAPL